MKHLKKHIKTILLGIAVFFLVLLLMTVWGEIDGGVGGWDWDTISVQLAGCGLFLGLYRIVDLLEGKAPADSADE